jgi:hypothetical protein
MSLDFYEDDVIVIGSSKLPYRIWGRTIETILGSPRSVKFGWGAGTFTAPPLQGMSHVEVSIEVEENGIVFEPELMDDNQKLLDLVRARLMKRLKNMVCVRCEGIGWYADFAQRKDCATCYGFGGLKYCSKDNSLHAVGLCPN